MSRPVVNACACSTRLRRSDSPPSWMRTELKSCPKPCSMRLRTSPDNARPPDRARAMAALVRASTSVPPSGSSPPPIERRTAGGVLPSPSPGSSPLAGRRNRSSTWSAIASASCSAGSAAAPTTSLVCTKAATARLPAVCCSCNKAFDIEPEVLSPALAGAFSATSLRCSWSCCALPAIACDGTGDVGVQPGSSMTLVGMTQLGGHDIITAR